MHADLCADSWTDPVGELYKDGQIEEYLESEETSWDKPASEGSEHEGNKLWLKEVVKTLAQNLDSGKKTRISIMRKCMFQDYIKERKKKWFNSRQPLKVTFSGEPAIEDGGQLHEFFTGLLLDRQFVHITNSSIEFLVALNSQ